MGVSSPAQFVVALFSVSFLAACGGGGGKRTPEEVIHALVDAGKAKDAAAVEALFPTQAQLDAAMTCEPDKAWHEEVARNAKKWAGAVNEFAAEVESLVKIEPRDPKVLKSGETRDGCTANTDVTTQKLRVTLKTTKGKQDGEGMDLIKLGDSGWFLLD